MKLTKELRTATSEKDDISRRLQISLEKNKELENKINLDNSLRENSENAKANELQKQLESCKNSRKQEISELNKIIKEKEKEIKTFENSLKIREAQQEQIFSASSTHFMTDVPDFDTLIKLLLAPKKEAEPKIIYQQQIPIIQEKSPNKLNVWKQRFIEEQQRREENEADLIKRIDELANSYETKLKEKDETIEEMEKATNKLKERIIKLQENKEEIMKNIVQENVKHQLDIHEVDQQHIEEKIQLTQEINKLKIDLEKTNESNENYKKQLINMMKKTKNQTSKIEELTTENEQINAKINENKKTIDELTNKTNKLAADNTRLNDELLGATKYKNELQARIRANSLELNSKIVELEKARTNFANASNYSEEMKTELEKSESEKKELFNQLHNCMDKLNEKSKKIDELTLDNTKLKKDLIDTKQKVTYCEEKTDPAELIPYATWSCQEFPEELNSVVLDIAKNRTLRMPTKIRNIMSVIARWYSAREERITKEMNINSENIRKDAKEKESFYKSLSSLFSNLGIDSNTLLVSEESRNKIIDIIKSQKSELSKTSRELIENKQKLSSILSLLQVDSPDEAKQYVDSLQQEITSLSDRINATITETNNQKEEFKNREENLKKKLAKAKNTNESNKEKIKCLVEATETLQRITQKQKREMKEIREDYERKINEFVIEYKAKVTEVDTLNMQTLDLLNQERQKRRTVEAELAAAKEENTKLQKTTSLFNKNKDIKEKQLNQLQEEKQKVEKLYEEKLREEKEQIKVKYENMIKNQSDIIEEMKESDASLKEKISNLEGENKNLIDTNNERALEIHKYMLQIQALKQELEREKKLNETQLKAQKGTIEAKMNAEYDALRLSYDEKKRQIYSLVCNHFSPLFDSTTQLDDSNFDIFIKNTSCKLKSLLQLENNLRSLLSLGPRQSIVDAVSVLLL